MKLHTVHVDGMAYCVPSAFTIILGCTYFEACRMINRMRNKPKDAHVSGVSEQEIDKFFKQKKMSYSRGNYNRRITLKDFVARAKPNTVYFISFVCHVAILFNGRIHDNHDYNGRGELAEYNRAWKWKIDTVYTFE